MRRHGMTWLLACVALLASARFSQAGADNDAILVIAHKDVATGVMTRDDLRPIFQTKKNTWPDGASVKAFNLPEADSVRRGFDAAVLGLDPARVVRYWIDRKIRGGDRPPQNAPSAAVMLKVVGKTPGAIGYVDSKLALDASVKVVAKVLNGQIVKP